MKTAIRIVVILLVFGSMSFKLEKGAKQKSAVKSGVYGTCLCIGSELNDTKSGVRLTLNDDNTFAYFDNMSGKPVIDIKGTWTQENGKITLADYNSPHKIHTIWKVDAENNNCLKSHRALEWRRLCRIADCK
jgi:hypothetical protein